MADLSQWEYKCAEVHPKLECLYAEDMQALNDLGWVGWELVAVVLRGESTYAYFKRPTPPPSARGEPLLPAASEP